MNSETTGECPPREWSFSSLTDIPRAIRGTAARMVLSLLVICTTICSTSFNAHANPFETSLHWYGTAGSNEIIRQSIDSHDGTPNPFNPLLFNVQNRVHDGNFFAFTAFRANGWYVRVTKDFYGLSALANYQSFGWVNPDTGGFDQFFGFGAPARSQATRAAGNQNLFFVCVTGGNRYGWFANANVFPMIVTAKQHVSGQYSVYRVYCEDTPGPGGDYDFNDHGYIVEAWAARCSNNIDDDGDGLVDLHDPGCAGNAYGENEGAGTTQCQDGADNDGDGLVDMQDPGCANPQDNNEGDGTSQCQNGVDDDQDGATDFPNDFSCSSPTDNDETNPKAQCQDGIDNDADGLIDFGQDPGCSSKQDNNEGDGTTQCQNRVDDDQDGATDYPNDFSCSSPTDNDETNPKAQCQDGIDNDGDGKIDFGQDPGCSSKQDNNEGDEPVATPTRTATATGTAVPVTPTATRTAVPATPTATYTAVQVTSTPTRTPMAATPTGTATPRRTKTPTPTCTVGAAGTQTAVHTATPTPTCTVSPVVTGTATPTPTCTVSPVVTSTATPSATSTPVTQPVGQAVIPIVDCVKEKHGKMIAYFGYRSEASTEVSIPLGASNRFSPAPEDRGQPTSFLPGRIANAVTVKFTGGSATWQLGDKTATADSSSPRCSHCRASECNDECETRSAGDFRRTMRTLFRLQRELFFDMRNAVASTGGSLTTGEKQHLNAERGEALRVTAEARRAIGAATNRDWRYCWSSNCTQHDMNSHIAELRDANAKMHALIENMAVALKTRGMGDSDIAAMLSQGDELKARIEEALSDCPRFVSECQ